MIRISGNDILRGSEKIGWIEGNDVYDHDGTKLGYWEENDIYTIDRQKLGYIEGNLLVTADGRKIRLDENRSRISGGSCSDIARAAIRLLLGD